MNKIILSLEDKEKMVKLYEEGKSTRFIADVFDLTFQK